MADRGDPRRQPRRSRPRRDKHRRHPVLVRPHRIVLRVVTHEQDVLARAARSRSHRGVEARIRLADAQRAGEHQRVEAVGDSGRFQGLAADPLGAVRVRGEDARQAGPVQVPQRRCRLGVDPCVGQRREHRFRREPQVRDACAAVLGGAAQARREGAAYLPCAVGLPQPPGRVVESGGEVVGDHRPRQVPQNLGDQPAVSRRAVTRQRADEIKRQHAHLCHETAPFPGSDSPYGTRPVVPARSCAVSPSRARRCLSYLRRPLDFRSGRAGSGSCGNPRCGVGGSRAVSGRHSRSATRPGPR